SERPAAPQRRRVVQNLLSDLAERRRAVGRRLRHEVNHPEWEGTESTMRRANLKLKASLFIAPLFTATAALAVASYSELAPAEPAHQAGNFGVGIVGGIPDVGLSLNYFTTEHTSLQINPVLILGDDGGIGGRIDYLFWPSSIARGDALDLVWFFGPGGR